MMWLNRYHRSRVCSARRLKLEDARRISQSMHAAMGYFVEIEVKLDRALYAEAIVLMSKLDTAIALRNLDGMVASCEELRAFRGRLRSILLSKYPEGDATLHNLITLD